MQVDAENTFRYNSFDERAVCHLLGVGELFTLEKRKLLENGRALFQA